MSTTDASEVAQASPVSAPTPAPVDFKVYRPPHSASGTPRDVPDAYFTPSAADLRAAQASLSARTQALVNAPLRTQAMRDDENKKRLARWPNTTIRVRFSDRTQLEKAFPSTSKIRAVYAFVRGSLREDVKPIKFVLYQTPPPRELKVSDPKVRDLSLLELQLAPSSVLHLKFENDELNHVSVQAPLDPAILARAEDLPLPPQFEDSPGPSRSEPAKSSAKSSKASTSSSSTLSGTKVPKWLKLGPNK